MILDYLSSPAKICIYKLLVRTPEPLCFREIVSLTKVGIRSAQIALKDFLNLKIVKKKRSGNLILYSITTSSEYHVIKNQMREDKKQELLTIGKQYSTKAKEMLSVIQDLNDFSHLVKARVR